MPKSRDPEQASFDPVGAVLSIVGIVALVYGLIEAPDQGLGERRRRSAAFAIAVVVLALFVAWELHVDEPMLDMHYFRNPAFSTGTGGMILVFLVDVRRDVPHHAVLPARARLQPARRPRCGCCRWRRS